MIQTVEADGAVRLLEQVSLNGSRRALVTILDEEPALTRRETAILTEAALSDWDHPEEDAPWSYLESGKSFPFSSAIGGLPNDHD